jgi:hypothetical protein
MSKKAVQGAWSPAKYVMAAQVIELGRLRELTLKGSLASPTSITWKGTSTGVMETVNLPLFWKIAY